MATVFVYEGPSQWIEGNRSGETDSAYVNDGHYWFYQGREYPSGADLWIVYDYQGRKEIRFEGYASPEINRDERYYDATNWFIQFIGEFNADYYGSHNRHYASGGSMYTMREYTSLWEDNGDYYGSIQAGDMVIIGKDAEQGTVTTDNRIRMWGYRKGGRSGTEVETYGLWVSSDYQESPNNYTINTL